MYVQFIDLNKKKKRLYIGFSWWYFFLGPIYLFFRKRIVLGVILSLLYYWMLPYPFLDSLLKVFDLANSGAANVILYFRSGFAILLGIFIVLFIHIFVTLGIEKRIAIRRIDKYGLLPATSEDAEKLSREISKYQDLPVHPSYIKDITFLSTPQDNNSTVELRKQKKMSSTSTMNVVNKNKLDRQKQTQLNTLYEKYNSGFISFEELQEMQERIMNQ